ncbi:MAG: IS200/IS605 family transposase [Bacteroidales bacterium]|nr:IS200/IS605 family transposase [Bacteroidales bacterium]MDP3002562.1 IS200/IS605 family transposase [Bacteroidales bacterium]
MSYLRIWLHCVWTTNNKIPYLRDEIRNEVIFHIRNNAKLKGIYIDHINGYHEHLHALISLGGKQTVSEIMQKIKGESSFWINKNKLTRLKFEWQDDFYSVSIGMSQLDNLRKYIRNQEQHHQKISFQEELDSIIAEYNLQKMRD